MKKKMLIATDCLLPRWDGIARFLNELIPNISKDYDITVIGPEFKGKKVSYKGVKIIRIKTYNFQIGDFTPPKIKTRLIRKEVRKNDIIFAQTVGPIGAVSVLHGSRLKKKVVSFIHSFEWELFSKSVSENKAIRRSVHHITKTFVKRIYNKSNLLVVPSEKAGALIRKKGITTEQAVVKLGIDTKKFRKSKSKKRAKKKIGLDPNMRIIGYAGRIGREKDIPTLIRAFREIKKKSDDIGLMIVGSGINIYDKEMEKEGIYRFGSTDKITDFLQAMDIYVLPSHTETSSLSTMEAMACGLPVMTAGAGETKNYVVDGRTGFRFRKSAYRQLAGKILLVIHDEKRLEEIGSEARQTILQQYHWNKTIYNLKEVLRS